MNHRTPSSARVGAAILVAMAAAGCGQGPETDYGASRSASVNGVSVFRALLEARGHTTRAAVRLNDEVAEWAEVIVRFAPHPGRPDEDEGDWYDAWLQDGPESSMIYVCRDFDAEFEYWTAVLDQPGALDADQTIDARERRDAAAGWAGRLPHKVETPAPASVWFAAGPVAGSPAVAKSLSGPWSAGVDAAAARIPVREPFKTDGAQALLEADGAPIVLERDRDDGGRLLMIANGGFLLNAALAANPARRPLAERVEAWIGPAPRRVAFVEGSGPLAEFSDSPTLWDLLARLDGLRMVAIQLAAAGIAAALARAPRLGKPRSPNLAWGGRPTAHAEALGALLARAPDRGDAAREILAEYDRRRRDRNPNQEPRRDPPVSPS